MKMSKMARLGLCCLLVCWYGSRIKGKADLIETVLFDQWPPSISGPVELSEIVSLFPEGSIPAFPSDILNLAANRTLSIDVPKNGSVFPSPDSIHISISGNYTGAAWAEVLANGMSLGWARRNLSVLPPRSNYEFIWTNAAPGNYTLAAVTPPLDRVPVFGGDIPILGRLFLSEITNRVFVKSDPVDITVLPRTDWVEVKVTALDSQAIESNTAGALDSGLVLFSLSHPLNYNLPVFFDISGTASNGIDYAQITNRIVIPAGASSAELAVSPLDDGQAEFPETVVLTLTASPLSSVPPYRFSPSNDAVVTIKDNDVASQAKGTVEILKPASGATMRASAPVSFEILAADPVREFPKIEVYANERKIGDAYTPMSSIPKPGTPIPYVMTWTNPAPGSYILKAVATNHAGVQIVSTPVMIILSQDGSNNLEAARRKLPAAYEPGKTFSVEIEVNPPVGTLIYALEDSVPSDWPVSLISHNGDFDPVTYKVKFGPFTDHQSRTLSYRVTPPAASSVTGKFFGSISLDGKSLAIEGDNVIGLLQPQPHPADCQPEDWRISLDEITAYLGNWMRGQPWLNESDPIPAAYVTRAAVLWKQGESYYANTNQAGPPQWWMPSLIGIPHPDLPTNSGPVIVPTSLLLAASIPSYKQGVPLEVTISVQPKPEVMAYAVEDRPPSGWKVTQINEGGQLDLNQGLVKWFFFDDKPRMLTYTVLPPLEAGYGVAFEGWAVFDSAWDKPLILHTGQRHSFAGAPVGPISFGMPVNQGDGILQLTINGFHLGPIVIETSTDWMTWSQQSLFTNVTGSIIQLIPMQGAEKSRFYRARSLP